MEIVTPEMIVASPTSTAAIIVNRIALALRLEYTGRKDDVITIPVTIPPEADGTMSRIAAAFSARGWSVMTRRESQDTVTVRIRSRYDAVISSGDTVITTDDARELARMAATLVSMHHRGKVVRHLVEDDRMRTLLCDMINDALQTQHMDRGSIVPARTCTVDGDYVVI